MHVKFEMDRDVDRVLVLDFCGDTAALVKEYLFEQGFFVQSFRDQSEASKELSRRHYDFLVLSERTEGHPVEKFIASAVSISPDLLVVLVSNHEELGRRIRQVHRRFRRLPSPLVLESLQQILKASSPNMNAG